ncbi:restriction endonuclease subunit S [Vibrio alginolyticus]|uniref:restriction endonuclease subunit S n=1 Tax=Vibrio alginolyticus TaxID=663 RepID=UPI00102D9520|nr:restriction endonuclease subunit S [Vibrio alginolyticus]RZV18688.1 restriction endonuclease subunit S [Vibrio alginolyticus]
MKYNKVPLGDLITVLTDYHANGAYQKLKENVELLDDEDYALMVRTTNFESNDFSDSLKFISEHAYNFLEKSKVYGGDLIMNKIANAGSIYLMPDLKRPVSLAMNLFLIRVDEQKANPVYVYIFLKINEAYVKQFANGSVTKTITKDAVRNLEISLPPREVQNEIANQYNSLSKKIAVNSRINKILEEMAQAIFKSWFVDFDPVKAKMNGEQPEGMDAATASLFPEKLVDTEVGELPEGWRLVAVGELLDKTIGGDWGKEEPDEKHTEEVRIVRGTDIPKLHSGAIESVPVRYVESKKLKTRKLERGDIVIEVSGGSKDQPTGRSLFISDNILKRLELPSEPASFCRRFKPKSYEIGLLLAVHFQLMYQAGKTWEYQNQSTGISNFQTKYFLEAEHIVIPSDDVLDAFVKQVSPMMDMIHSNQNIELAKLRDTLLPKLLSGEIELGQAQELAEVE